MAFTTHRGARLYWKREGSAQKPTLLLLHSVGTDMSIWDGALPWLLPQFQVLRLDLRGHGASDAPNGDYSLALLAEDALAVLDAAGVSKAAVCGLSLGGMTAMELALAAPERVSGLVLACTSAAMDPKLWAARLETLKTGGLADIAAAVIERFFSAEFRRTHADQVESIRSALLAMPPDGYAGCGAAIRDMALADRIGAIKTPTLVIGGTQDVSTPFEGHGDKIVAAISGAKMAKLHAGHLAAVELPSDFATLVREFLGRDSAREEAAATLYEAGLATRRQVLGDAWVDRSLATLNDFNTDFQAMLTRIAWNEIWNRPGLDHRTRRLLVIAMTASLGRWGEFRHHVHAGLMQGGFTEGELKETLMQIAVYAGMPTANSAFQEAMSVMAEMKKAHGT